MTRTSFLLLLAAACGPSLEPEGARKAVQDAFAAANPPGRAGLLLEGKAVWLQAGMFDDSCLEQKDLAFNDDPKRRPSGSRPRISPTYMNQRWITASTPTGYCVYLGTDPTTEVGGAEWVEDRYLVEASVKITSPSPWFECLEPEARERTVQVVEDESGGAKVMDDMGLFSGDCPRPLPEGEERRAGRAPTEAPPKPPTRAEVVSLAERLEDAFYRGDFGLAQELTSCYNLFEKERYGTCSVGEYVAVGPSLHGDPRPQDGTPWLEYSIASLDDLGAITRDGRDPTLFHVNMTHKRTGRDRSFAVQWVGGKWKMVGVIGLLAEGLTTVRYVYDLHRPDRRAIFQRRLEGEELDEKGNPPEELELPG